MDLKITVFKSTKTMLDNKHCFRETVQEVPEDFEYSILVKSLKMVFGVNCVVELMCI